MNFQGRAVVLRAIEREDLRALRDFHNDPAVGENIEFSWPLSMGHQERFFERVTGDATTKRLVIEVNAEVVGYTGLWGIDWVDRRATTGIVIGRRDLQGAGLGTDAVMTIARVAFEDVGLHRLDAEIFEYNAASMKLYVDKCGWTVEGRRREHVFRRGRWWDRVLVGQTAGEYAAHVAKTGYWTEGA